MHTRGLFARQCKNMHVCTRGLQQPIKIVSEGGETLFVVRFSAKTGDRHVVSISTRGNGEHKHADHKRAEDRKKRTNPLPSIAWCAVPAGVHSIHTIPH